MRRNQEGWFRKCGGSLTQNVGTITVDPRRKMRVKAKETMSTRRTRRARGKRIGLGPAPCGDRRRTPAKQVGQGMSDSIQETENRKGDTLSEDPPTTRRKLMPHYGGRSALSPIMSQKAPKIGLRSLGRYMSLRRLVFRVLNACTPEARPSATPSLHRSSDLP